MLFNSIEYLIYLPIVFLLYWLVFGKRLRLQNLFVVVVSYLFYGWWDYRFLVLIALTSFCSWLSGIGIEDADLGRHDGPHGLAGIIGDGFAEIKVRKVF